ncbi:septum formation protein [Karstenula rhodostoma CBS 690.94]|uniref:Septum formation protein n=1 Tax=Karstenula rhodostoma CBS 690.94 TaxID=1392251 RepID=A0A9P4UHY2_9PLEO|nr:septum formation protein [Karstenula rhodostoma CBS 690.94]
MASQAPADPPPSYEELPNIPTPLNASATPLSASATPNAAPEPSPSPRRPPGPPPLLPLDIPALNQVRHKRVVLASTSPRRKQLLSILGLKNVEIIPSTFKEDLSKSLSPYEYVLETASEKCRQVYSREVDNEEKGEPALVIAADTIIISSKGRILEKPRNPQDHLDMLKMLRDEGTHKVATAVVVMKPLENPIDPGYAIESHVEITSVKFDANVSDATLVAYVRTRDGNDKAGGYGIQSAGSILIEKIEGAHDNVIGLPLRVTLGLIEKVMVPEEGLDDNMDNMFADEEE